MAEKKTHRRDGKTQLKIWLDIPEKEALTVRAEEAGFPSVTDYIRSRCIEAKPKRRRKGPDVKALHRLVGHAGKMGSNINQQTAVANKTGRVAELQELEQIRAELQTMTAHLVRALGYGS